MLDAWGRFSVWDAAILAVNVVLLALAKPIVRLLTGDRRNSGTPMRLRVFRFLNILTIAFIVFYNAFLPVVDQSWITAIIGSMFVVYLAYLGYDVLALLIRRRYGRRYEIGDETRISETYMTRALSLLAGVLAFVVALIGVIQILGFQSLLEAGGVIGFIGVLLALTQAAWAPDIISGLIILNSKLMEEGDVIELDDGRRPAVVLVFRIKMFHTEALNLVNNHRMMIKNASLRGQTIRNLSKFASARGLRERLTFRVGYEVESSAVEEMITRAYRAAVENPDIDLSDQHPVEVRVLDAGDYGVQWGVYYYVKEIRKLITVRQLFRRAVVEEARACGISLATPMRHVLENAE